MSVREAYNTWSSSYDTDENKTRDLEALALRTMLQSVQFENCLEIGCGTGKNTEWLLTKRGSVTAVDLSEEMLGVAKSKLESDKVTFIRADILQEWNFTSGLYDLVTFSLVLEHIENLEFVIKEASRVISVGGHVYIGELHPYKQYAGSKARFQSEQGEYVVQCYTHNISEFTQVAVLNGFQIVDLNEFFDNNDKNSIPRIFTLLLKRI
jgi:ubiquinone/menaquinone biosynthesis C-methylase UbiE